MSGPPAPGIFDAFSLQGRVALVTGASRGLGRAAALALSAAGASLALAARSAEGLEDTAKAIVAEGGPPPFVVAVDVVDPAAVDGFVGGASEHFGRLDVLINNAGIARGGLAADTTDEDWADVIATNLTAPFYAARSFVRRRRVLAPAADGPTASIVNMGSVASGAGVPTQVAYSASKTGLVGLTRTMALELARDGIRVNTLAPGYFASDMPAAILENERTRERLLSRIPTRRIPDPSEIGPPIVFLASDASAHMTGATLFFDGGYTASD